MICCAYGACSQTLCHSCMYAYVYVETVFAVVQFKDLFHGLNMYAVQNKICIRTASTIYQRVQNWDVNDPF